MSSPPGWWDLEKRWSCSILFHLRRVSSGAPVRAAVGEGAGGETLPSTCSGRGQPELRSLSAPRTQIAGPASQHWPPRATCSIFPMLPLFSRSVVSDSVQPCELQHARLPCPSACQPLHSSSWLLRVCLADPGDPGKPRAPGSALRSLHLIPGLEGLSSSQQRPPRLPPEGHCRLPGLLLGNKGLL